MKIFKEQKLKASTMNTDIISDRLQSLVIRTWFFHFLYTAVLGVLIRKWFSCLRGQVSFHNIEQLFYTSFWPLVKESLFACKLTKYTDIQVFHSEF